jgi:hypothetical protein
MTEFVSFRWKNTGVVEQLPADYAVHPIFGELLEPYDPESGEYEEDKVVADEHELPVEQRVTVTATPITDANGNVINEGGTV